MATLTMATLNINGLLALTRVGMLNEFLRRQDIDVIMLQEETCTEVLHFPGYTNYHNVGAAMRGTAIMVRDRYLLTSVVTSPTGRAMAGVYGSLFQQ
jgi:exonuclease III